MRKKFNDTGICVKDKHFMVNTSNKLDKIMDLIDFGEYFTLNRPRQFGKTTTADLLYQKIQKISDYLVIDLSFEGIGNNIFKDEEVLSREFINLFIDRVELLGKNEILGKIKTLKNKVSNLSSLSKFITEFVRASQKKVVLIIDEVDKSSNNTLFLHLIGMFRDKYLLRNRNMDFSFQSIILIGVHDIKNLKKKLRPDDTKSLNSPWNIAVDFNIDMSFSAKEIETMLLDYIQNTDAKMNVPKIAERLYYYTSGYPYLVSKMCKVIDEIIKVEKKNKVWSLEDLEDSFKYLVNQSYTTTLFDDLAKNLNNNKDLYQLVFDIVINGQKRSFNISNPIISIASTYGILKADQNGHCQVHNRIFEKRIYDMMLSIQETKHDLILKRSLFEDDNGYLNLEEALLSFQEFMHENYSTKDEVFLERQGRLLFMSFLKPVLNGKGFDFKEPVVGNERRTDIVITYLNKRYVVELKRWQGERYHDEGLQQLSDYLDLYNLKEGFLLIYDFRKEKSYKSERITFQDKSIFTVWV